MLTIQNRIAQYHYAYGLWPDDYQYPHPYSIHEYFNKETLELFERAFAKGEERPSAYEWQEHLYKLMHGLKQCKNDKDHSYFTSKGCGLCSIEDKFTKDLKSIKQQKTNLEKIRGFEISELSPEKVKQEKALQQAHALKMERIFYGICLIYLLFFGFLYKMAEPLAGFLPTVGLGVQFLIMLAILFGINRLIKTQNGRFPLLKNKIISDMIQVYALILMLITIVDLNDLPRNLFELAGLN